jgi:hypothetical protein
VKAGEWSGHPWQLIAYPSSTHGLCVSVTPAGANAGDSGGGTTCSPFAGVPRTAETNESSEMTITFLGGSASVELPAYIAGPVIDKASTVEIRFGTGEVLRLPTFSGPASLAHVRFYATQLPATIPMPQPGLRIENQPQPWPPINTLAGLDSDGNVVACLAPRTASHPSRTAYNARLPAQIRYGRFRSASVARNPDRSRNGSSRHGWKDSNGSMRSS